MLCYPTGMADSNPDYIGIDCGIAQSGSSLPRIIFDMGLQMQAYLRRESAIERFSGCYECFLM
jgi:hypothetical protein